MEKPFKVIELDHLVLRCRELERMRKFYCDVLGLVEERRLESIGLVQLRAGTGIVDLLPAPERSAEEGANMDHFCLGLAIDDMDRLLQYLGSAQVEIIDGPSVRYGARGYGPSIYVRDPEGNTVELKQAPR